MDDRKFQILGLIGFISSGSIFVVVGLRAEDMLTVGASVLWIASCIVWLIPLVWNR